MKNFIFAFMLISIGAFAIAAQETTTTTSYMAVDWSPDGKYLSYTELRMTNTKPPIMKADIYIVKADGSEPKKITGDETNDFGASWAKNGKRLIFGASPAEDRKKADIFSINRDGTNLAQLTKNPLGRNSAPVVSRDGKKIVFNSELVERKPQIYVMSADGSNLKALTADNTIAFYSPVWSPDGKKIVYYTEKGDNKDQIWVMNADGTNQTLLTNNIGHNFYPSWSADGKQIIFSSNRDGQQAIYTMNADGANIKRLSGVDSSYVRYSPNGKRIAFVSGKFPNMNIFVANADGTNQVKITNK